MTVSIPECLKGSSSEKGSGCEGLESLVESKKQDVHGGGGGRNKTQGTSSVEVGEGRKKFMILRWLEVSHVSGMSKCLVVTSFHNMHCG